MSPRRRQLPEHLEAPARAFDDLLPALERARAVLTESVPGTRLPGRPLAETLSEFEEGLREVRGRMDAWRSPDLEPEWDACSRGLEALGGAPEPEHLARHLGRACGRRERAPDQPDARDRQP